MIKIDSIGAAEVGVYRRLLKKKRKIKLLSIFILDGPYMHTPIK